MYKPIIGQNSFDWAAFDQSVPVKEKIAALQINADVYQALSA